MRMAIAQSSSPFKISSGLGPLLRVGLTVSSGATLSAAADEGFEGNSDVDRLALFVFTFKQLSHSLRLILRSLFASQWRGNFLPQRRNDFTLDMVDRKLFHSCCSRTLFLSTSNWPKFHVATCSSPAPAAEARPSSCVLFVTFF
uniref:Uncharacterized protein n=1 Tax=Cacopsylla melanoneura TaxID=428564 RepID=A0A8D9FJY2_9HEMI